MTTSRAWYRIESSPLYNPDLAPVAPERRTWGTYNFAALWVSMSVNILTYMLAAGLIQGGMNWKQAVATVFLGNSIVLIPMLLNAHAGLFPQISAIAQTLPDPIDQMKFFELIQIIPAPTKSALGSGNLAGYVISDPTIMGYLRNNSIFTFGHADRARTSATFREILDAMWLFNDKFERASLKFDEIKSQRVN